jgi:spore maturation protein CgeB
LIAHSADDTYRYLTQISEEERKAIGASGRKKVLSHHTAAHRASELETYYNEALCQTQLQPTQSLKIK